MIEPMAESRRMVEAYLDAIEARDYSSARTFLADEGFEYKSPIASFLSADDFVEYTMLVGGIIHDIERRKVFVDGDDVCHFLVFVTQMDRKERTEIVQWSTVVDGRIRRIEVLFDAHQYKMMFEH